MENCNIEVEARSFLTDSQYENLLIRLRIEAEFIREIDEETVYFFGEQDLRMRRNKDEAYLILKKGKIHDKSREETEIKFEAVDFEKMQNLFETLGYELEIKWLRKRLEFKQDDVKILLDDTKGYGKIIEIEKMVQKGEEKNTYKILENRLKEFGIKITLKDDFNKKFEFYKKNWKSLIK